MKKDTFNINVLTPGKKKKKYSSSHKIFIYILPLFIWMVIAVGLYFFLYLPTNEKIQGQHQNLQQLNQEQTDVNALHKKLEKQQAMYLSVSGECIDWSSKLISFSINIPKDLWISKLIFIKDEKSKDKSRLLDIYGQTISTSHKESLDKIAIFMEEINKEQSFRKEFLPLKFIYSQLQDEENRIMDFKLSSSMKLDQRGDIY